MRHKIISIFLFFNFIFFVNVSMCFSQDLITSYLFEKAISLYKNGKLEEARQEFKKILLIEPSNEIVSEYIQKIESTPYYSKKRQIIELTLEKIEDKTIPIEDKLLTADKTKKINKQKEHKREKESTLQKDSLQEKQAHAEIKGEVVLAVGVGSSGEVIWKRANADLNEKNWRILDYNGYNRGINTYDPRIYDRLRLNVDTLNKEGLNFHTNIAIDPWSFIGKSEKITVTSSWGDSAEIELKYWSNTGYTVNEAIYTNILGNSFNLPEIKVKDGKTSEVAVNTTGWWPSFDQFNIPSIKIKREIRPLRELWFDYQKENLNFRFFPLALQNQAFTSDDPLRLSNNHIWWEESPWLWSYKRGNFNSGPGDFTKGSWDDSLAFFVRDSDGTRLTFLRGISFEFQPHPQTTLSSTFASPLTLWQDYDEFDNLVSATRIKQRLTEDFQVGALYTFRTGFKENKRDLLNHLLAVDLGYEIQEGLKMDLELATSRTDKDITNSEYRSELRGNAIYFSLVGTCPPKRIIDLKYGYDEIKPKEEESNFGKWRLYLVHMDEGFDPALANFRQSRKDAFWSRHIHFREPLKYYYSGLYSPPLNWEDIEPFKIGNGIDTGRDVVGLRIENSLWNRNLKNLFDVRNVHSTNGKFIENVLRDEINIKIDERLTTKILGIYHKLPKTKAGVDPFLFDKDSGDYLSDWSTDPIDDAKDPTLKTGSLGLDYKFFDWLSLNGIWEYTNDYTLAYDNFPRGILNSAQMNTYIEDGKVYRYNRIYLYDQQFFPQPPYPFYNIFKLGLKFMPLENLELYLDYTHNEFKSAGPVDDNMNHVGIEVGFLPNKKLGFYLRYTYSRWNELDRLREGQDKCYLGHHNLFSELRYRFSVDDELILQYGESGKTNAMALTTFDPYGGGLSTIDTLHMWRLYYQRKF
ncbi:MAG: tetratricopeptide repeat protein [Candidatus Omnitrophica bacterium]|nr:tetratricopeptide repeat protein [Candidatus Omnitrophota bacterium]